MVLAITLDEVSAKIREGDPKDDDEDYDLDIWGGVVPLKLQRLPAIPDTVLKPGVPLPHYLK